MATQGKSPVVRGQPVEAVGHVVATSGEGLASEQPHFPADTLCLVITDIEHMFNAPPVDPMSPGAPEVLGIAGVEYLLQQLEIKRPGKLQTVRLVVPESQFTLELSTHIENAVRRYAEYRILQQQTLVRETRRQGWRLTGVATLLLAFFLALSSLFASEWTEGLRPLLRKTLEYGFEIIGWVMLWHPIEVLVFQPISINTRIRALRKLRELPIVVDVERRNS